jgi:CheY-like chemotaxis protein
MVELTGFMAWILRRLLPVSCYASSNSSAAFWRRELVLSSHGRLCARAFFRSARRCYAPAPPIGDAYRISLIPRWWRMVSCPSTRQRPHIFEYAMNPILVVDDNETYRELVVLTLQDHCGVPVHDFDSAAALQQHLAMLAGAEPALILLDLHMPGLGGLELLQEIRTRAPAVPVAFLSGAAAPAEREACLAAGAFAFLRKPVAYADLVRGLQDLVQSVQSGRAAG